MAESRRFCENCGTEIRQTTNFCPNCGAAQSAASEEPTGPPVEESEPRRIQTPNVAPPPPPAAGRSGAGRVGRGCLGIVVILVILVVLIAIFGNRGNQGSSKAPSAGSTDQTTSSPSGGGGGSSQSSSPGQKQSGEATVGVGQTATVADGSWVVNSAYPTNQLTDQFGVQPPKQGNFVVVDFTFANNGSDPKTLTQSIMKLTDSSGRNASPDTDTFGYIPNDKDIFLNQVNPGVSKDGEVIFSVAPGSSGYTLELSNTNFLKSDKAAVNLGF